MELRWYFVLMVTAAIAISYFDRQTLPVAISAIQRNIAISNQLRCEALELLRVDTYAAPGVGSFVGGGYSSRLLRDGHSMDRARKIALRLSAVFMPLVMLVALVPVEHSIVLFSAVFFCHQSWSGLIMTLPADIFPLSAVGTVSGLIGFGGAIGGAIFGVVAGRLLGHGFGYGMLFVLVRTFHLICYSAIIYLPERFSRLARMT